MEWSITENSPFITTQTQFICGWDACLCETVNEKYPGHRFKSQQSVKQTVMQQEEPKPREGQGSAVSQAFFSSHYFYFITATKEERWGNKTKPKRPKKSSSTCCPLLQHLRFEQLNSYGLASSLQVVLCNCRI